MRYGIRAKDRHGRRLEGFVAQQPENKTLASVIAKKKLEESFASPDGSETRPTPVSGDQRSAECAFKLEQFSLDL